MPYIMKIYIVLDRHVTEDISFLKVDAVYGLMTCIYRYCVCVDVVYLLVNVSRQINGFCDSSSSATYLRLMQHLKNTILVRMQSVYIFLSLADCSGFLPSKYLCYHLAFLCPNPSLSLNTASLLVISSSSITEPWLPAFIAVFCNCLILFGNF